MTLIRNGKKVISRRSKVALKGSDDVMNDFRRTKRAKNKASEQKRSQRTRSSRA